MLSRPPSPTWDQLKGGCSRYHLADPRDPFYRGPQWLLERAWARHNPDFALTAAGLGTLAVAWNTGYYRGLQPDFVGLENFLRTHRGQLLRLRRRSIDEYEEATDDPTILRLFRGMRDELSVRKAGSQTIAHVPTGKVLHLLAPSFLPIWDGSIADRWGCYWKKPADSPLRYRDFLRLCRKALRRLGSWDDLELRCQSLPGHVGGPLKLLDEWNYMTYS